MSFLKALVEQDRIASKVDYNIIRPYSGDNVYRLRDIPALTKNQSTVSPDGVTQMGRERETFAEAVNAWNDWRFEPGNICVLPSYSANKGINKIRWQNEMLPAHPLQEQMSRLLPLLSGLTFGESNYFFYVTKIQKNPIFQISVDILSNTNFFQAFTASANVPAIYLQQFWKTMSYNEKTGVYSCQLDEQWFRSKCWFSLLRKAIAFTPSTQLTFELRRLLIWEESLLNGIQIFFSNTKQATKPVGRFPKKKVLLSFPYGRFSKCDILLLAEINNIHRVPDFCVVWNGNPDPLITEAIRQSSYYPMYMKMVAENTKKTPQESASVQPATKRATPKKPTTTTPVQTKTKQLLLIQEPSMRKAFHRKLGKGKPAFQLVDEEDVAQQDSIPQRDDDDPDRELSSFDLAFSATGRDLIGRSDQSGFQCQKQLQKHDVVERERPLIREILKWETSVKDHKRKHDSDNDEDDDDDEALLLDSNRNLILESETLRTISDDISKQDMKGMTQIWRDTTNKRSHFPCDKERKIALSISKLKAARYLDFGLEELVPSLWVESERDDYLSDVYDSLTGGLGEGIYINKHSESFLIVKQSDRDANSHDIISTKIYDRPMPGAVVTETEMIKENDEVNELHKHFIVILPEHPSETMVFHNEDGNPARANIKQALGSKELTVIDHLTQNQNSRRYLKDGDGDGNSQF
ncbi:hypothetical protein Tco_0974202 [Tanacetum coccineum]|uniref:Uncharacterized protein n=1 Tax=Tanacetum coccineum TaxID=301880 RepID=A0ABQ5EAX6_9ASTR